jgi:hypothetical protein
MNKNLTAALALIAALVGAAPTKAATTSIDGPSADILDQQSVDVDMAPDGAGALAYLKKDGGLDHVFLSRYENGSWTAPQRVDTGLNTNPSRNVSVAVANGGKVVVTFLNAPAANQFGNLYSAIKPAAGQPLGPPADLVAAGGRYADVELAANGVGYAAIGTFGNPQTAVMAKRLVGTTWAPVGGDYPDFPNGALEKDEANNAGETGDQRGARIAVAPDGASAVAVFTEETGIGEYDVIARRLTGTTRGPAVEAGVASFGGFNASATGTDMADVDMDATGTAWVVLRQSITYSATDHPRCLARPLTGDTFGAAQLLDALPTPPGNNACEFPRVEVNGSGLGLVAGYHQMAPHDVDASRLAGGTWSTPFEASILTNDSPARTATALGENGSGLITWRHDPGGAGAKEILGRTTQGGLSPELALSNTAFGTANGFGLEAAADNGAKAVVAFTQGAAATTRIVAAVVDLPQPPGGGGGGGENEPPPQDITAPDVTGLALSRTRFRLGGTLPRLAAVRTGTRIRFMLSEAATIRLRFRRLALGRLVGGRCVKPTRLNRSRRRCTRSLPVRGSVSLGAQEGVRRIRFAGRLSRRRSLKPGRYRLILTATDAAGNISLPDRVRFRLLPRRR